MLAARLLLAVVAGLMAGVSFEPFAWAYLLPVSVALLTLACFGPSVAATGELTRRSGFLVGGVFGITFMLVLLPWLRVIGVDAWIAVAVVEGLFYALLGLGTTAVTRLPWWPLWTACLWVGVELLRATMPFGGFPWGRLGFATADTPVAPLFAYAGAAGATFAVAVGGSMLAWAVLCVRRTPARAVGGAVLTAVLVSAGGLLPLSADTPREDQPTVTVAAVQGDVPGEGMDAFAERRVVLENHVVATEQLATSVEAGQTRRPDVVLWPENSTDISPFEDDSVFDDISAAVDAVGVPVLVGALVDGPEPDAVLNQGIVWEPSTGPGQRYTKIHPVPFGEYIPFRDVLQDLTARLDQIPRDMRAGSVPGVLDVAGTTLGDVICFEVAYDGLVRDVVRGGAELVVVQTNNATYTGTSQASQQFAISRLRAIETNRFVVAVSTNGVSGIADPIGQVVARAPVETQDVLVETISLPGGLTPAVRFGFWVELLLAGVGGLALGVAFVVRRR